MSIVLRQSHPRQTAFLACCMVVFSVFCTAPHAAAAVCGNSIVEVDAGENCDPPGGCCGGDCHVLSAGSVCRPVAGG